MRHATHKFSKRLSALLLCLALLAGLLPTAAWAEPVTSPGGETINPGDGGSSSGSVTAGNWSELLAAITNGTTDITLGADVPRGSGTGTLTISENKNLTINLNGHTLDTGGTDITVSSSANLTIKNELDPVDIPEESSSAGKIIGRINVDGGTVTIQDDVEISGNTATNDDGEATTDGGAIYVAGGTVTLKGSVKITGNRANVEDLNGTADGGNGGGIYVATGGEVTIPENANVEITGNKAARSTIEGGAGLGGGVYNAGTFTMEGGAIYGNSAGEAAADFYNAEDGSFALPPAKKEYAWYQDGPDQAQRYTGTQEPLEGSESGLTGTAETRLAAEVTLDRETTEEGTVVFKISDAEDLAAFRDIVNGNNGIAKGDPDACAKLMKDITIYEDLLDENGSLNGDSSELVSWEPICTSQYTGTFDGQGHTIYGLYCEIIDVSVRGQAYAGLFRYIGIGGKVQNLNVKDSFVSASSGTSIAGGICGQNNGAISGCTFSGSVSASGSASSTAGGVCGENNGAIENCRNDGSVTASNATSRKAGGVCGLNADTVRNCLNTGKVTASGSSGIAYAGGVCGNINPNTTVTNCYYRTGADGEGYPTGGIGISNGAQDYKCIETPDWLQ